MASSVTVAVCFAVLCSFYAGFTLATDCYSCDRISITDYNGADQSGVDAALTSVLSVAQITNNAQCDGQSLTNSELITCESGEVCYVMLSTFDMDFNSEAGTTTVSAEGEIHYCLLSTERLPDIVFGCEDESHDGFSAAAANSIGLLASEGSPFSNTASYDGQICKCTTDGCNSDLVAAAANEVDDDNDDDDDNDGSSTTESSKANVKCMVSSLLFLVCGLIVKCLL